MAERAQHHGIGVALPDHVDMPRCEIDRLARKHPRGDVVQHPITHVDCIVEANDAAGSVMRDARNTANIASRATQELA